MLSSSLISALLVLATATSSSFAMPQKRAGHQITIHNNCPGAVTPIITDTKCGYSPRCADAASYTDRQPNVLQNGQSDTLTIPSNWVGRIFAQTGSCGVKGESCTVTEWNMDSGDFFTPQSYDISNIQGFTQSVQIGMAGCDTVTCKDVNCGCRSAYPPGDLSGCGNDSPVHACGSGDIGMSVVFCP
ncbi:hypothetical protein DL96DRAFT_377105 [Flagelloscypha sp. PMI_526]|nr:hypothetical protein DL96DRAFT_377105 [Flagelloscypha sp. PMI_526]